MNTLLIIGVICPLTPSSKTLGISQLQGITLAIEEINRQGGINNRPINLIIGDDQSDPDKAVHLFESIIDSGVYVVMGPCNSSVAKRVIERILIDQNAQIPIVSAITSATELTKNPSLKNEFFFRANASDMKRINTLLEALHTRHNIDELAIIYEGYGDTYGEGLKNDAISLLKAKYNYIKYKSVQHPRNIDLKEAREIIHNFEIDGIRDKNDAYLLLNLGRDAVTFVRAIRENKKISSPIYLLSPKHQIFQEAKEEGVNIEGIRVISAFFPKDSDIVTSDFITKFEKKYNESPTFAAALAYDATKIVLDSIKNALSKQKPDGSLSTIRIMIKEELLNYFETSSDTFVLTGRHEFSNNEYIYLRFKGYHLSYDNKFIPWNEPLPQRPLTKLEKQFPKPGILALFILYGFGIIGSLIRVLYLDKSTHWKERLKSMFSLISFIIDPIIAIIIYSFLYLFILFAKPGLFDVAGDTQLIFMISALVVGAFSGVLGIRAIYKALENIGVGIQE